MARGGCILVDQSGEEQGAIQQAVVGARSVLEEHGEYLRGNETRTRALVIDQVLGGLGWDIRDPERVWLEHRCNGNAMDYVLLSGNGHPLAVVEAKPADSGPKDKDRRQASGYAQEIGARYAVLTNGGRWEAWRMVQGTPRRENVFVEVHLTTGEIEQIASTLGKLQRSVLDPG